jgi:hypothetical protein
VHTLKTGKSLVWIAQRRDCLDDTREPVVFVDTVRTPETFEVSHGSGI